MKEQFSRRDFLKAAGVGAAAVAIGGGLTGPGRAFAAPLAGLAAQAAPGQPNPQMQAVLDAFKALDPLPLPTVTPRVARELPSTTDAQLAVLSKLGKPCVEPVGKVQHKTFHGPGGQLLLRIYSPAGSGPFPVIVYYHGGGFVIANLNVYDPSCRALTNAANAMVVSVAYRLAPEAPFPAAPMDSFAAYQWVLANIAGLGGDPSRVAVAGESAGGNLAAVTAMMARDKGVRLPVHQLLVYPVTSMYYLNGPDADFTFASYAQFTTTVPLNTPALVWFYKYYLRNEGDRLNPYASPLRGDVRGLPPATVINAEIDPLRDEGEAYKNKLAAAGIAVGGSRYPGVTHEFFSMSGTVDVAKQAVMDAALALKKSFGTA